jgi:hypothetical protein
LKVKGESGLFYTGRCLDEFGEPLGYQPVTGANLLDNLEQRKAFERLPRESSFTDAKRIYGRADDPTNKFLKKCESLGLTAHNERGNIRKSDTKDDRASRDVAYLLWLQLDSTLPTKFQQ